jgi:quercetin dioxygenase-like cupin family protein
MGSKNWPSLYPRRLRPAIGLESATGAAGRRLGGAHGCAKVVKLDETEIVSFGPLAHYQPIIGDEEGTTPIRTGIQTSQPGYEAPMHSHPYLEILHILDGTAEAWQEGRENQKVLLRKGDTIALPPGVPHSFRVVGQEELRLLGTHVSPTRIVHYRDVGASDPRGYRAEDR